MVNRDNTLTVHELLHAVANGLVNTHIALGVVLSGKDKVLGVEAFELHTYPEGRKVLVIHCNEEHLVAERLGDKATELF